MQKRLGKIGHIEFGYGGYQEAQFGLTVTLNGEGWGVQEFTGGWGLHTECTDRCKWTEKDRSADYAKTCRTIDQLLIDAKKRTFEELQGVPIEATFNGNVLETWRILTEVL